MSCDHSESLGRLIYLTAQELKNMAEKVLNPSGLTLEQFQLLKNMSRQTGMTQRELGQVVYKTPANMTRILDRLETKSLITRKENPDDRRASLVFLTKHGESLVQELFGVLDSFSSEVARGINEQDKKIVRKVLARITENINTMSDTFQSQQPK